MTLGNLESGLVIDHQNLPGILPKREKRTNKACLLCSPECLGNIGFELSLTILNVTGLLLRIKKVCVYSDFLIYCLIISNWRLIDSC